MNEPKPPQSMARANDWSDGHFAPFSDDEIGLLQKEVRVAVRRFRRARGLLVRRPFTGMTYIADHMGVASNLANEQFPGYTRNNNT